MVGWMLVGSLPLVPPSSAPTCAQGAPSARIDSGYAPVAGGRLYYESAGRGPTVVLIHGGNLDRRMWDNEFRGLARRFHTVRYDVRSFGRSSGSSKPYASHEDLYRLLQFLGVPRASVVGLSLGGRIAVDFALSHPSMVERLVLAGPGLSGFRFSGWPRATADSLGRAIAQGDSDAVVSLWLSNPYMIPAMEHPELRERLRRLSRENARAWFGQDVERPLTPPAIERLSGIRAPTLVIVGARDVPDIHRIVDFLAAKVPGARRVVVPGAGHLVNLEDPAEFDRLVNGFLSSTPSPPRRP